jgi:hypothetical protein
VDQNHGIRTFILAMCLGAVCASGAIVGWNLAFHGLGTSEAVKTATANTDAAVGALASDIAGITRSSNRLTDASNRLASELGYAPNSAGTRTTSAAEPSANVASSNGYTVRYYDWWDSLGGSLHTKITLIVLIACIVLLIPILLLFHKPKAQTVAATDKPAEKEVIPMRVETELRIAEGYAIDVYDEVTGAFKETLNAGEKVIEKDWKTIEGWAKAQFGEAIKEMPKAVVFVVRTVGSTPNPSIQGTAVQGTLL